MKSLELVTYTQYPHDEHMKEVAEILVDDEYLVVYGLKTWKDGGKSWTSLSSGVKTNPQGDKKWLVGFGLDSRKDNAFVGEWIKEAAKLGSGAKWVQGQTNKDNASTASQRTFSAHPQEKVGEPDWGNPPF